MQKLINTFKIKQNFYHKNINNLSNLFFKVKVINYILKFLPKFNDNYDNFFLIFNKIELVVMFVVW